MVLHHSSSTVIWQIQVSYWLIDWLIDWSNDWLCYRLTNQVDVWLIGLSIDCVLLWLIDWFIDWQIDLNQVDDWLIDWLIDWLFDQLIYASWIDWLCYKWVFESMNDLLFAGVFVCFCVCLFDRLIPLLYDSLIHLLFIFVCLLVCFSFNDRGYNLHRP